MEYREKILHALKGKALSMNELARAMGYKGISAKLSSTLEKMLEIGTVTYSHHLMPMHLKWGLPTQ